MRASGVLGLMVTLLLPTPSQAASMDSEAFATSVRQEVAFLAQSSRVALVRASDPKLRAFAKSEAGEQLAAFDELKTWSAPGPALAYADSLAAATPEMDSATPLASATVLTGRSVAIDAKIGDLSDGPATAAPGVIVMPRLESASGAAFDLLYRKVQAATLQDLAGLYSAYLEDGQDPALRAIAGRNLPLVKARLEQIGQL